MAIRIGNDIKLYVQLTENSQATEIKSARAVLVNATEQEKLNAPASERRFPQEPGIDAYSPNATQINNSGSYSYYTIPQNVILDRKTIECDASVEILDQSGRIAVTYYAKNQQQIGTYNLIVIAEIADSSYADGYRTITIDKPSVFTLVGTTEAGVDGTVELSITDEPEPSVSDEPEMITVTMFDGASSPFLRGNFYQNGAASDHGDTFSTNDASGLANCSLHSDAFGDMTWDKNKEYVKMSYGSAAHISDNLYIACNAPGYKLISANLRLMALDHDWVITIWDQDGFAHYDTFQVGIPTYYTADISQDQTQIKIGVTQVSPQPKFAILGLYLTVQKIT